MSVSRFKFSVKPQEAILILITMFWGGTFLAVQYAVTLSDPFFFVGLRFATAAIAVALVSLKSLRGLTLKELKAGVAIGVAIAMGYSLQTWGLQTISSSKSAFITAMYVPLVPLLQWLCLGRLPGMMSCIGIVLAFIGLILLAGPENNLLALGPGEIITLVGAIAIAAEIILISAWAGKVDVKRVTVVQLATASLVAFATMVPAGESVPPMSTGLIVVALGLGIVQRHYSGHHELGAEKCLPDACDRHLHRRTGLGRYFWPHRRRTAACPGPAWRRLYCRRRAGERTEVKKEAKSGKRANLRLNRVEQKCPSSEGHWLLTVLPDNVPPGGRLPSVGLTAHSTELRQRSRCQCRPE